MQIHHAVVGSTNNSSSVISPFCLSRTWKAITPADQERTEEKLGPCVEVQVNAPIRPGSGGLWIKVTRGVGFVVYDQDHRYARTSEGATLACPCVSVVYSSAARDALLVEPVEPPDASLE
jgi:hypothetical protein